MLDQAINRGGSCGNMREFCKSCVGVDSDGGSYRNVQELCVHDMHFISITYYIWEGLGVLYCIFGQIRDLVSDFLPFISLL